MAIVGNLKELANTPKAVTESVVSSNTWNPSSECFYEFTLTGATSIGTINAAKNEPGRILLVANKVDSGASLTLTHTSTGSTATGKLHLGGAGNRVLTKGSRVMLQLNANGSWSEIGGALV
jgi:hypothetical protein